LLNGSWDDLPSLTDREVQVLELIASGLTAKEVARRCSISPRTVHHHIGNIRNKLRARNNAHIIAKATMLGALGTFSPERAAEA
jgi:DNA-binding CsgD family transcriptional regulator